MSEEQEGLREEVQEAGAPEPEVSGVGEQPAQDDAEPVAQVDVQDAEEGKVFAILSYALSFVGLPFFLIPLIMRNNEFALYHAKQSLIIWLGGVVVSVVGVPLMAVCIGVVLVPVGMVFLLVLNVMGLINAVNCQAKPVPLVGKWGESWFKGLKKA